MDTQALLVNGRYRLIKCLGEGGMGTVYLAADLADDRPVALKRIRSEGLTPETIEAFKGEFALMTPLRHPNVVEVFDFGRDAASGDPFLTLEYVEGVDLRRGAEDRPLEGRIELLAQVCRGLGYIHSRGLTHNDLKPENILVTTSSPATCKLMDFGLASLDTRREGPAGLRGTLHYLAPEVIAGGRPDRRSDLYSLGVVIYLVMTGRLPFEGEPHEVLALVAASQPMRPRAIRPDLPEPLDQLIMRLLSKDPASRLESAAAVLAALNEAAGASHPIETPETIASAARSARFVGRSKELERLLRLVGRCAGRPGDPGGFLAMISGESGIGKSRLLRQLRYEAQLQGLQVIEGRCYEGAASAFHPFIQALRQLFPESAGGDLASLLAMPTPEQGADPERERRRLSDAAVVRLIEASSERPLMIGLEDLQWADTATLSLLEHLARNAAEAPGLLLAVTYRTEEADAPPLATALPRLARAGSWERVELSRLKEEHVAEILQGMFVSGAAPEGLAELVARETEGNPFFVQMALQALLDDPSSQGLHEAAKIRFPRSMTEAIARRLSRLDKPETSVVEALAVAESPVKSALLADLASLDPAEAGGAIERLRRRRLVRREIDTAGTVRLRFDHVKVRDHVYETMDWQKRRELHGRIGVALETQEGASIEELAHHFTHSGDDVRALSYAERAGRHALSVMASERAAAFFERALELVSPAEPARRLNLQLLLGDAFRQGREHPKAMETYDKVIRGARTAGLKEIAWTASLQSMDVQMKIGQLDDAQRSAERLAPALEMEGEKGRLARCLTIQAAVAASQARLDEARRLNERALALRRETGELSEAAANLHNLGTLDALQGATQQGLALLEESLALHQRAGDTQRGLETLHSIGTWHRIAGNLPLAAARFEEAIELARRSRDRWMLSHLESSLAHLYHLQGIMDKALALARSAAAGAQAVGLEDRACEALDVLGKVQRDLGDLPGAIASHERATAIARRAGLASQEAYLSASLALDRLAASPQDADLRSIRDGLRKASRAAAEIPSDKLQARLHEAMGRCHLAFGDHAAAAQSARDGVQAARSSGIPASVAETEILLAACLKADPSAGDRDQAAEAAQRAAETAAAALLPEPRWQAHAALAGLLQKEGRRGLEREEWSRAAAIIQEVADSIQDEPVRRAYLAEPRRAEALRRAGPSVRVSARKPGDRPEATPERTLSAMYEITEIINSMSDLDVMLERLLDVGLGIVAAERGMIILMDEASGGQQIAAARDLEDETVRDALDYSRSVVKDAASGQIVVALDAHQDDRFRNYKSVSLYSIKSLMCVPMRVRERVVGTVYVDSRHHGVPFTDEDLKFLEAFANLAASAVEQARLHARLSSENVYLRREAGDRHRYQNIIGKNVKMQAVYDLLEKVASSNLPVLIQGESGTGKELVARALHYSGPRRSRKFYSENVAAIPDTLLESEMFGHMRGAFTGADRDRKGLFELADGGTLFLDEIGDMSLPMQAKLLRAIQEGEIRPVGGKESRKVDVRIISASNKNLEQLMQERLFREDLYFRLNVVRIPLPPLRERKEDIPLLVDHFLQKSARETGRPPKKIEMGTMQLLLRYRWPGNIRELENEIQRLAVLSAGDVITQRDLMDNADLFQKITALDEQPFTPLEEMERQQIEKALLEAGGNRVRAAEMLGISRATIFRKLRKFNLPH